MVSVGSSWSFMGVPFWSNKVTGGCPNEIAGKEIAKKANHNTADRVRFLFIIYPPGVFKFKSQRKSAPVIYSGSFTKPV